METTKLKKFAQHARRTLMDQVSAKLKLVLADGSPARRENESAVAHLEKEIARTSTAQVIERVAYTWFNRFCALRFMDLNRYTGIGVVSPANGQTQPEILAEAKMGHIDESVVPEKTRQRVFGLLGGNLSSRDPQGEAYRLLLVSACNAWYRSMPFLFQRIADYTELLLPDDLLSDNSTLAHVRDAMTPEHCQDVEVIGWLYQFYISEKKDEVFDGLKKNKKITPENIPAATQLFTPHWIVRYLVENSLGRLWMLNRPNSRLIERMEYYIKPEQPETDFLRISSPEEIRLCDPACGSGHMLVYAFDLLYAIYEEEGYEPKDIPAKILKHNLFGIEIDERAGELAAFALTMKARHYDKRFLSRATSSGNPILPNICVLENVQFQGDELKKYMDHMGRNLFNPKLITTLHQFEEADNFGSLIRPEATDVEEVLGQLKKKDVSRDAFLYMTHEKVLRALRQADYLSPKYHVVVANPPYMGGKGMNPRLGTWLKANYEDVKADLFSAFIVRNTDLTLQNGQLGFMSPFVWMFISSYEKLRAFLINQKTITSLVQLEYSGFDGATVPICTFTIGNAYHPDFKGGYVRLTDFRGSENQGPRTLEAIRSRDCGWFYRASAADFKKIPGYPIAYWLSPKMRACYEYGTTIAKEIKTAIGLNTGDNFRFLRFWHEVTYDICTDAKSIDDARIKKMKWFPYNKGGQFRKWYGNKDFIINWENDGEEIKSYAVERNNGKHWSRYIQNLDWMFKRGITWTFVSSSNFGVRIQDEGLLFDVAGSCAFPKHSLQDTELFLGLLCTPLSFEFLKAQNPTLNFQASNVGNIPWIRPAQSTKIISNVYFLVEQGRNDWDSSETSLKFTNLPLLQPNISQSTLSVTYTKLRSNWQEMTLEMKRLEEENNRIFIEAYGLQDELTPEVPLKEITLTCNPHYRYGGDKTEEELEALLLADTMKEFISYSVGCMFGRYSLDKPGLILANQGEGILDFRRRIFDLEEEDKPGLDDQSKIENLQSSISFMPDVDNVIPILDGDWFPDDVTERFRKFLRVTFGDEHYEENLEFIEKAIGKDIRKYFLKDFYADHVRRYKKRPIYWLFTSPKGSFNALIYMHRYRPDTVSVVLNDYLREFRTKLQSRLEHLKQVEASADASKAEKTRALKEIEALKKTIDELDAYERDTLYPLATQQIQIDLDDGVKVNYPKFGAALKKIPGLEAKEE